MLCNENCLVIVPEQKFVPSQVSLGNEAFLLWSYFVASSSLPLGLRPMMIKASDLIARCFYKALLLVSSMSSFPEESSPKISSATDAVDGEDGGVLGGSEPSRCAAKRWAVVFIIFSAIKDQVEDSLDCVRVKLSFPPIFDTYTEYIYKVQQ